MPGSPKQSTEDMDILDNTECKFNVNSFKIVYVVNSEYYLYKRTALTKAREVSHRYVNLKGQIGVKRTALTKAREVSHRYVNLKGQIGVKRIALTKVK
jgi:hypothetical protein